jgi:signal transduction histidine kinase
MPNTTAKIEGANLGPAAVPDGSTADLDRDGSDSATVPTLGEPPPFPIARPGGDSAEDAADERAVSRRLRQRNLEISQLAGGLAHEIRNPLSTLSLNLDLLAEDFQNPESARDRRVLGRVGRLRDEVRRLNDILDNFLRFARIQDLRLAPTDLNLLIDELCDFYEPQATTQGIVVRVSAARDLPRVIVDADLFKQALLNLMFNAEHALLPEGGELMLSTRREGKRAVLDVTDTGSGMSEEVRARVFDAFYSTRKGGTGLGLPIARKIIEACGGTISVRSEIGKGSQFTIRLPLAAGESTG